MKKYLFLDLDNTFFQIQRKCKDSKKLIPAAKNIKQVDNSFMELSQKALFDFFAKEFELIPITARTLAAFNRVLLPFNSYKVLNFGGIILDKTNKPIDIWLEKIHKNYKYTDLQILKNNLENIIEKNNLDAEVRIIKDFDISFYLEVKVRKKIPYALKKEQLVLIKKEIENYMAENIKIHINDNHLVFMPTFLDKKNAFNFLKENFLDKNGLFVGAGDSISDLGFMTACDFCLSPSNSQIIRNFYNV